MRSSESRAIEATAQRSLAAGTEAREGDVNSYFMSSYENLASYRTPSKDEAALAREPLLDLHEKRTLVHAHGLALVLVEDALGVALDRRFFLEVRPQRLEHALVDLGGRCHLRDDLPVDERLGDPLRGAMQLVVARNHKRSRYPAARRLTTPGSGAAPVSRGSAWDLG